MEALENDSLNLKQQKLQVCRKGGFEKMDHQCKEQLIIGQDLSGMSNRSLLALPRGPAVGLHALGPRFNPWSGN